MYVVCVCVRARHGGRRMTPGGLFSFHRGSDSSRQPCAARTLSTEPSLWSSIHFLESLVGFFFQENQDADAH